MSDSCDLMDWSLLGSSVHGISQASILEWVTISCSRGSSWPRDWTQVSCIVGRFFTNWTIRESLTYISFNLSHPIIFQFLQTQLVLLLKAEPIFRFPFCLFVWIPLFCVLLLYSSYLALFSILALHEQIHVQLSSSFPEVLFYLVSLPHADFHWLSLPTEYGPNSSSWHPRLSAVSFLTVAYGPHYMLSSALLLIWKTAPHSLAICPVSTVSTFE